MSVRVKHDTFTDSLIMSNDTASPSRITIPNWAMDFITKDYKYEIDRLKAENAKLRKITRAHAVTLEGCGCDHCPHEECCDPETVPMRDGCRVRDELRELGVDA